MSVSIELCIVAETADYFVINKPSGLPSVPGKNPHFPQSVFSLLQQFAPPIYVVHRLDINTSGLIVFARTIKAQRELSIQFQNRKVQKSYLAWVNGQPSSELGSIEYPIITDWQNRPKQQICFHQGKPSLTHFKVLTTKKSDSKLICFKSTPTFMPLILNKQPQLNQMSLVAFKPITGRSHQLRIHSASTGHPIIGCKLYGYGNATSELMLHSNSIQFFAPGSNKEVWFSVTPNWNSIFKLDSSFIQPRLVNEYIL